jgi:hypothetical protein
MDLGCAIRARTCAIGIVDVKQRVRVGLCMRAGRSGVPHIKLSRRDLKHPIHESRRILALVATDTGVLHGDSLAKNTNTFFSELTFLTQNRIVSAEALIFLFQHLARQMSS